MNTFSQFLKNHRRTTLMIGLPAALVLVVLLLLLTQTGAQTSVPQSDATFKVTPGPLTISVTESGTIQPRERLIIKNELEGRTTIIYIVPEGTQVKKGDLVVELDASTLQDNLINQQIAVQNADAAFINARENLAVVKNQAEADIKQAQLDYEFAVHDLQKYHDGEYPKLLMEADAKITLAKETLNQAQEDLKWSKILFEEKYLSATEYQQDELTAQKAQLDLDLALEDKKLLTEYTSKRQIKELQSAVNQAELALERIKRKANASVVQAQAELQAKDSELKRQKTKLAKLETQIDKAKIHAPMDGQVVYATSMRSGWRGNDEPLREGQEVHERQELIHLPTTSSYMAEIKVHESSLEKITIGLPVRVAVDAIPGKSFSGTVAKIAPLPDAQSAWMNPDLKVYNTEINIQSNGEDLRSGMTCKAEVIVDHFDKAVFVPIQSVVRIGLRSQPTVFVADGKTWKPQPVKLGLDNNRMAHIMEGLKEGDIVSMTPPLQSTQLATLAGSSSDSDFASSVASQAREAKANPASNPPNPTDVPDPATRPDSRFNGGSGRGGGDGGFGGGRPNFQNMTEEQREQMRKRFENMSDEEREQLRQRFRQRQSQGESGAQEGNASPQPRPSDNN